MKKTKEEAILTRNTILKSAMKVFAVKGYAQTSLVEVAKEAGMTRGAIYWHFSNKYQLLSAVISEVHKKFNDRVTRIFEGENSPLEKIRKMIVEIISKIIQDQEFRVTEQVMVFKVSQDKELHLLYQKHYEQMKKNRQLIKGLIQEGIDAGEIAKDLEAEIVLIKLAALISGLSTEWLKDVLSSSPFNISLNDKAEELANLFIYGIAAK